VLYRLQLNCQVTIIPYTNELSALHALSENKLDAVIVDQLLTYLYFGALYPDQLQVVTQPLTNEGLRLMTFKKDAELVKKFNAGLQNLKDNGTYDRLLTNWDIYDPEIVPASGE
jgi:polar amino acid transport system substrate-binding protein